MSGFDEILCHCRINPDGHAPGSVLDCEAPKITRGTYARPAVGSGYDSEVKVLRHGALGARGTCSKCGKSGVQVKRVETIGRTPGTKAGTGPVLNVAPLLVEHKHKGAVCPGSGEAPAETRYTPGRDLASWVEVHGPESVAQR